MQYPAQVQTALELTDLIGRRPTPADRLMAQHFKARRYVGSSDKAVIADLVYDIQRWRGKYAWALDHLGHTETARGLVLVALVQQGTNPENIFTGAQHQPDKLTQAERQLVAKLNALRWALAPAWAAQSCPAWLLPQFGAAYGDDMQAVLTGLNQRANTDVRVNTRVTDRATLQAQWQAEGLAATTTPYSPWGLRLAGRQPLYQHPSFAAGAFEVQDEAPQLAALLAAPQPGQWVVDYCAGGGGKTLALAMQMGNTGQLFATDVNHYRLEEVKPRLKRAGVQNAQLQCLTGPADPWHKRLLKRAEVVVVDAPCSGSGTWRRNPDAKWKLTADRLGELQQMQADILASAARLVKPGGRLVYATCSLLPAENGAQVERFLATHPDFTLQPWRSTPGAAALGEAALAALPTTPDLTLRPDLHGCDGFYVGVLTNNI